MAILEPKNKGQNRQTMHLRFIYGSLRHVYNVKHGICTSSNKFLLGVIVKYCQFPRHKCFLLQNLLTKKLHNCGHFGQCTVLHIDYLYRQEGQKWSIIWWLVATHSLSQAVYTVNVYRGLLDVHRFSLQYRWKRAVRITEKPYTHQRERLSMLWGNPVIFTDCREIL